MVLVRVGVCSFTKKMYNLFNVVEVQQTFYNIPQKRTVEKWRKEAPQDFEFCFKVFQGLTHGAKSPTWRRFRGKLTDDQKKLVGNLQVNALTREWMQIMAEFAKILKSPVIVVQTPASFKPTKDNIDAAREFFSYFSQLLGSEGVNSFIGWEPRGDWLKEENKGVLQEIFEENPSLIHIVDPFFHEQVVVKDIVYFRLHGKPYLNYRYEYSREDFEELRKLIRLLQDKGVEKVYFMFNNVRMVQNALDFLDYLGLRG
ncbi:MAG: DUF72 domain-containing protein [Candidatus Njordarchaeales archaeon]